MIKNKIEHFVFRIFYKYTISHSKVCSLIVIRKQIDYHDFISRIRHVILHLADDK